jgi:hypothetical protein
VIDTVLPTTLALIVSAGRGEFDLKKVTPAKAWAWCCTQSVAIAAAVTAPKADTASIAKAVTGAVDAAAAEVTVEMPQAAAPAPEAPVVAEPSNNVPTESENLTPAP